MRKFLAALLTLCLGVVILRHGPLLVFIMIQRGNAFRIGGVVQVQIGQIQQHAVLGHFPGVQIITGKAVPVSSWISS